MTVLNKTRFFLATTALVAALQAQGAGDEPTTLPQAARIALKQPQNETKGHLLALPDVLIVKIAEHLSYRNCVNLSCGNKQIQTALAPVLILKQPEAEVERLVIQANKTHDYGNFLEMIKTEQGQHIMETLVRMGEGLSVDDDAPHLDRLAPYVTQYRVKKVFPQAPHDIFLQFPRLLTLDFHGKYLIRQYVKGFAEFLTENQTLKSLDFRACSIGDMGVLAIAGALKTNRTLKELNLQRNGISNAGGVQLALGLETNKTLTSLNLSDNGINMVGTFARVLATNTALTSLDLEGNKIGAVAAQEIARALAINRALTSLNLQGNRIDVAGAQAIARALATNKTLKDLNLRGNLINDSGAEAIADALATNNTLTNLSLEFNTIRNEGAKRLASALATNQTLTYLNLHGNPIGDAGGRAILEALRANPNSSLKILGLSHILISDDLKNEFHALARKREFKVIL